MDIAGFNLNQMGEWDRTRKIVYAVAKWGNSDPKSFPNSEKKFMPFDWDDEENWDDDILIKAARERAKKRHAEKLN